MNKIYTDITGYELCEVIETLVEHFKNKIETVEEQEIIDFAKKQVDRYKWQP